MFKKIALLFVIIVLSAPAVKADLESDWNDFLHYTKIGRFDLAKGYGEKIVNSEPDAVKLLELSKENPTGYDFLLKMYAHSEDMKDVAGAILEIIEQGRYDKRTDARIIAEEIRRLSSTSRARIKAIERLKNSGEYAIPLMLNSMADAERKAEFANITSAMGKIGRDAVRPLVVALKTDDIAIKSEIIGALGAIGYPQALAYLKYVAEFDGSDELRALAIEAIKDIDENALNLSAAELFYSLASNYYYQQESLQVRAGYDFGNVWFWNDLEGRLYREQVDLKHFYYMMTMRSCEWALKADPNIGKAIGLWLAAFYKAEETGVAMPKYFGEKHADAMTYASTAGPEYLHQALKRALVDKDTYVALGAIEALAVNAGEKSLLYRIGTDQPLVAALSFENTAVRYSAAIAIGQAGPSKDFAESKLIVENLSAAIGGNGSEELGEELAGTYALRAMKVMLKLATERNKVIDLMDGRDALIDVTISGSDEMKILAGQVLARLESPAAQRAIAVMAMNDDNEMNVKIEAYNSLAVSAKINGNILEDSQVNQLYSMVSSETVDASLRSGAAGAYGALNLPSAKVKELILDQSKL